jgi:hypothetical protein
MNLFGVGTGSIDRIRELGREKWEVTEEYDFPLCEGVSTMAVSQTSF